MSHDESKIISRYKYNYFIEYNGMYVKIHVRNLHIMYMYTSNCYVTSD